MMLKTLWDVTELVKSSFNNWNMTLWRDINVEQMESDCKNFVKVSVKAAYASLKRIRKVCNS